MTIWILRHNLKSKTSLGSPEARSPSHQTAPLTADQTVSIGDTYDFEYVPDAQGELHLEVRTSAGGLLVDQLVRVVQ